jgi:hypothetical protein
LLLLSLWFKVITGAAATGAVVVVLLNKFDSVGIDDAFAAADAAATSAAATDAGFALLLLVVVVICVKLFVNEPDAVICFDDRSAAFAVVDPAADCMYVGIRRLFNAGWIVSSRGEERSEYRVWRLIDNLTMGCEVEQWRQLASIWQFIVRLSKFIEKRVAASFERRYA